MEPVSIKKRDPAKADARALSGMNIRLAAAPERRPIALRTHLRVYDDAEVDRAVEAAAEEDECPSPYQ